MARLVLQDHTLTGADQETPESVAQRVAWCGHHMQLRQSLRWLATWGRRDPLMQVLRRHYREGWPAWDRQDAQPLWRGSALWRHHIMAIRDKVGRHKSVGRKKRGMHGTDFQTTNFNGRGSGGTVSGAQARSPVGVKSNSYHHDALLDSSLVHGF
ncbi:MAG: hypothetical protein AAFQ64_03750 [Pseudomonadota bacterium]